MKVIHLVPPPCDCRTNLEQFRNEREASWGYGTIVECDCGTTWAWTQGAGSLGAHAGPYWKRHITNDQLQDR